MELFDKEVKPFKIWSIVNLTTDSFYKKSRIDLNDLIKTIDEHLTKGTDIIDIGAESSRPYSKPITWETEYAILDKALSSIKRYFGENFLQKKISIDTYKPQIIKKVLDQGVSIINDITAGKDPQTFEYIKEYNATIVLMHSLDSPEVMQINPQYVNVVDEVKGALEKQIQKAYSYKINPEKVIIDVGIGFGKTVEHNFRLLKEIKKFFVGNEVLVGISRKSFIGKALNQSSPDERLLGTYMLHTYLALQNIHHLRVHDVKETNEIRTLLQYLNKC